MGEDWGMYGRTKRLGDEVTERMGDYEIEKSMKSFGLIVWGGENGEGERERFVCGLFFWFIINWWLIIELITM